MTTATRSPAAMTGAKPEAADRGEDWICFAGVDWWHHSRAHSEFQLMLRVARRRKVLVVNSMTLRMPLPGRSRGAVRKIVRKARSMSRSLQTPIPELPTFHVITPLLIPLYGSASARSLNARLVRAQVQWACRRVGIADPICLVTIPTAWDVVRQLSHRALLVNRCDKYSEFGESDRESVRRLEEALIQNADRVLYVSHELMAEEANLAGERAYFLDHGVDTDHFRPRPEDDVPADLRVIPRPRIGYFGTIDDYTVDVGLLVATARAFPEANLVFIGDVTSRVSELRTLPNVHLLGRRAYETIPYYGAGFDVALMPWLDNSWIRYCNPIKLKEYLALGLPVVSTWFPEIEAYRDVVVAARGRNGFLAAVGAALRGESSGDAQTRRAAVLHGTWDDRVDQLLSVADEAMQA